MFDQLEHFTSNTLCKEKIKCHRFGLSQTKYCVICSGCQTNEQKKRNFGCSFGYHKFCNETYGHQEQIGPALIRLYFT